ncbi:glycosyltransferase family 32 protein [Pedobacter sp. MR22-3]|uniref:glycosyltransferase family 32 protein n=1 Tax=Pedobacter sp. MR22-3 TaxID=2994552 RepID=UPI0022457DF1|nr:glycosyltransferase [Pedobacter sp. MR22-3]MCX2584726.1 glycosyltransferase [Pedobacter sp. MR22-3]
MLIPKIIHQTWKDNEIPAHFQPFVDSWKNHHPDWEYHLWTDEMNEAFIRENYPDFLDIYRQYPSNIQKVDAIRYFILNKKGGLYVDLDFFCFKNIMPLLEDSDSVFGLEHEEHVVPHQKDFIISNALMASAPQSEFIGEVCKELYRQPLRYEDKNDMVLETTGPFMLTRIYMAQSYSRKQVKIVHSSDLYPLTKTELDGMEGLKTTDQRINQKLSAAYAIHCYWGSWWK